MQDYLDQIKWNEEGLVAAIAQDHLTGEILMMAWMNRESLALSITEQRAIYWSRSRRQLWRKGESSGHEQLLKSVALDCDGDALLIAIEQKGGIACHTGRRSCFYRELKNGQWQTTTAVIKEPGEIYK